MKNRLSTYCVLTIIGYMLISSFTPKNFMFTTTATEDAEKDNVLTKEEKEQGWKLLFDGKSLNGWRTYQKKPSTSWTVSNGTLVSKGDKSETAKHADLITEQEFENFELSIDWKIPAMGNSGIMYLVTEKYDETHESGPEFQLADDKGYGDQLEKHQKTGANYAMNPPILEAASPVGEWNRAKIIVNKGHVEHWLNGKKVVDYDLWSDEWKQNKNAGKWKDAPGYAATKKGHIALQESHSTEGGDISFKNIKIREL